MFFLFLPPNSADYELIWQNIDLFGRVTRYLNVKNNNAVPKEENQAIMNTVG